MSARFNNLIAVMIDGEWIAVDSAERALRLLENDWPADGGPSFERALISCRSCIDLGGPTVGAKATFAVAAMEACIPFELYVDYLAFTDAQVAFVAERDVNESHPETAL
jgi:hypothetical protein